MMIYISTTFTIKVKPRVSNSNDICLAIKEAGNEVVYPVDKLIAGTAFLWPSHEPREFSLAICNQETDTDIANMYNEAGKLGLVTCLPIIGPELCLQSIDCIDSTINELVIAIQPIRDNYETKIFVVLKIVRKLPPEKKSWKLMICSASRDVVFPSNTVWLFRLKG